MKYYTKDDRLPLPYDPWTPHSIGVADLEACAKAEGVQFKQGDILVIRVGFTKRYNESSQTDKDELRVRESALYVASISWSQRLRSCSIPHLK